MSATAEWADVLAASALPQGARLALRIGYHALVLLHTEAGLYAIEDRCPHAFQPLRDGTLSGGDITCARHGACFDLATGKPRNGVSERALKVFPVRLHQGRIEVRL